MATTKTATVTVRLDPGVKDGLRTAAAREHRSIANMVEVLIREYCDKNDIPIDEGETVSEHPPSGGRKGK